jgi:N,N'-diacetyllegionaminate synthase
MSKIFPLRKNKTYIVAEAEINHNGNLETALEMINSASQIGADAIKFQYIIADEIATPGSKYHVLFKKVELTHSEYQEIMAYANSRDIDCFFTVPSLNALQHVTDLNPPYIKIGSSNINNIMLLDEVSKCGIPVILSTGMATIGEIETALNHLTDQPVALLHCTVQYPVTDCSELNLKAISTLNHIFPHCCIGYSDHTIGSLASSIAVVQGAKIVEKHFTLDCKQEGPDHEFSTDIGGFKNLIESIKYVESALGDGVKRPSPSELKIIKQVRRYLIAAKNIDRNEIIRNSSIAASRIEYFDEAVGAEFADMLIGWRSKYQFKKGDPLDWTLLKNSK